MALAAVANRDGGPGPVSFLAIARIFAGRLGFITRPSPRGTVHFQETVP